MLGMMLLRGGSSNPGMCHIGSGIGALARRTKAFACSASRCTDGLKTFLGWVVALVAVGSSRTRMGAEGRVEVVALPRGWRSVGALTTWRDGFMLMLNPCPMTDLYNRLRNYLRARPLRAEGTPLISVDGVAKPAFAAPP